MKAALYLIPVEICAGTSEMTIPAGNLHIVKGIRTFVVENLRTARRCLRHWDPTFPIDDCTFHELNGHTDPRAVPGADAVAIAQREGLPVVPLVGPSSILLSLMASGFNGQGFAFNGYLPVKDDERLRAVRELEGICARRGQTQIFIETPYRNNRLLRFLASNLRPDTMLCVACDITDPDKESIRTLPASRWKKEEYDYDKRPAIFLMHRDGR